MDERGQSSKQFPRDNGYHPQMKAAKNKLPHITYRCSSEANFIIYHWGGLRPQNYLSAQHTSNSIIPTVYNAP